MRNELWSNNVTDQGSKIWSNSIHSLLQVLCERITELDELDTSLRKAFDLMAIDIWHILSHRDFGSINNLLSFFIIKNNILDCFFHFVSNIVTLFNLVDQLCENNVVIDDFCKLWEMPWEPFFQTHNKSIDILVHLLNKGNGLNNWFVLPVDVLCTSVSWEAMTKT